MTWFVSLGMNYSLKNSDQYNFDNLTGMIVVDSISSSPFDTRSLGRQLVQHQLQLIDCPVTQTYMDATDATESTVMVGSDLPETFGRVKTVLDCMFNCIFHVGHLGNGHAIKSLNNYTMAYSINALRESLVAGQEFGLVPHQNGVCFTTLDTFWRDGITKI